jgi:hypothetical protein
MQDLQKARGRYNEAELRTRLGLEVIIVNFPHTKTIFNGRYSDEE